MGGTRCIFRDCQVSTQRNPKMHFFRLPVRDPIRLEAWLKNCGNESILNIERDKLSNRAVCARHFRYECFMNYKLDRLIPNQTPTLARINKELAWDLERLDENGEATIVKLIIPTLAHLRPPEDFECPLGFTEDTRFGRKYAAKKRSPPKPLSIDVIKKQKVGQLPNQETVSRLCAPETSDVTILNIRDSAERPSVQNVPTAAANIITVEVLTDTNIEQEISTVSDTNTTTSSTEKIPEDMQLNYDQMKLKLEQLTTENAALKQSIVELEAVDNRRQISNSASLTPVLQLTKPQLYNSIKKYLGPTMAALVRMEMFGSAERTWKDDEREFAKELLQLGEHVYVHCCDEWRFRLPSLRMTRGWLKNITNPVQDEDHDP